MPDPAAATPIHSLPLYTTVVEKYMKRVVAETKESTRNPMVFKQIFTKTMGLRRLFRELGSYKVSPTIVLTYTVLHQVETAMMLCLRALDQYESRIFTIPYVFPEVYNQQFEWVLKTLTACEAIVKIRLVEITQKVTADKIADSLLEAADLGKQGVPLVVLDYTRTMASPSPVLSLPRSLLQGVSNPSNVLQYAAQGRWSELDQLLRADRGLLSTQSPTFSLLHMAALWQDTFAVAMLLSHGADVNACTTKDGLVPEGSTPLHIATALGDAAMLKLLLCWGAMANIRNRHGLTVDMLPTSLECSVALDSAKSCRAPVLGLCQAAAEHNFGKLCSTLHEHDLPVNVKRSVQDNAFPLHHVAAAGHRASCQLLLDRGASPLLRTSDGRLPSEIASDAGHGAMALMLRRRELELAPGPRDAEGPPRARAASRQVTLPPATSTPVQFSDEQVRPRRTSIHGLMGRRKSVDTHGNKEDSVTSDWVCVGGNCSLRSVDAPGSPCEGSPTEESKQRRRSSVLRSVDRFTRRLLPQANS